MANMRNGLETWLKKECVDTGHELSELNLLLVLIPAQLVSHNFETAQFMLSKAEDKLRQANEKGIMTDDVYHTALDNVRDLVKRHGTELQPSPPFEKYNEFLDELEVRLLEKVVECQCGKSEMKSANPNLLGSQCSCIYSSFKYLFTSIITDKIADYNRLAKEIAETPEPQRSVNFGTHWQDHLNVIRQSVARMEQSLNAVKNTVECESIS